ncbi:carbohydrate ABC transporter permease [Brachybacterium fresconis]|uniref:Multiple sugar transport system permease protein n=1 Tax=Brachybacterium fresconis TaxID=173363 RepID=A0ABS4YNI4_9MICO|nr:carbohydrate ABC transporter permease [Brachybacterium fresconis]MBP2410351.1 multiple sugar transport system permease protein [Brachybacterium fresconis]
MRTERLARWVLTAALVVFGAVMLAPLVWLMSESFTEETSAFYLPPSWIPRDFTLDNFASMAELIPFGRMFLNSVIVSVVATTGALLVSVMAAYAFSRLRFRFRDRLFALMLAALMVPMQLTVIPVFILMRNLQLVDTLGALILPALINVFAIFFFRQYFNSIPRELDEAATLDGAGHGWILFRMLLPLSGPALAAMTILNFEATWNNYFGPLIFIRSEEQMTLPIGLVTLQAGQSGSSVVVFAAITAVVVPALVVFLLFQRAFIASVATAGVRG